ncbi:type II secretion system protein GspL [Leclercia adecarboxylata]|uniref:type II secretion system protein GspL n=1 Tax=Leclercia adecarboxylata TaxID=83655 RepID=UPI001117BB2D|nr:type II secretion system protein GspL [Leclercia adecarboxylata]QCZ28647.1 type II secretion system protein GspL [Leclercia adecarboxylata]
MKKILFIRPDSREDGTIAWCESGSQQVNTLSGMAALATLADHPLASRVCLLLPASETIFRHFSLPKKGLGSQATPFSWMAEETLIGDVDDLHWTVLSKKGCEVDAVAIDARRLRGWLACFEQAGLKVVQALPDAWLLPVADGGTSLVSLEDSYWLRFATGEACEADAALLPLLLQKTAGGEVRCYGDAPASVAVDETLPWQHPLALIQPQWQGCRANVLHGEFSPNGARNGTPKGLKGAMVALALLSVGLLLGPRLAMALMLVQQENHLQQEIATVYQYHFPSLRQQTNIKYHFGQNLKKVSKGVFLQMDDLNTAKQRVPGMEVNLLDYDSAQNSWTLSTSSQDSASLQAFISQTSADFDFSLQPVSTAAPFTAMITGKHK